MYCGPGARSASGLKMSTPDPVPAEAGAHRRGGASQSARRRPGWRTCPMALLKKVSVNEPGKGVARTVGRRGAVDARGPRGARTGRGRWSAPACGAVPPIVRDVDVSAAAHGERRHWWPREGLPVALPARAGPSAVDCPCVVVCASSVAAEQRRRRAVADHVAAVHRGGPRRVGGMRVLESTPQRRRSSSRRRTGGRHGEGAWVASKQFQPKLAPRPVPRGVEGGPPAPAPASPIVKSPVRRSNEKRYGLRSP